MTMEDVKVQVEALIRELEEEQRVSMMCCMIDESKVTQFMLAGEPVDLLISCAIGVGHFLADHAGDMSLVKPFCNMVTEVAKKRMNTAERVN